jgi:deazaflavin-dependent oxidoreductase (nitroreductase family)
MADEKLPSDVPMDINQRIAAHIKLYFTDPEKAHLWDGTAVGAGGLVTTLLLTTTGRKSGKTRNAPLLYVDNNGSYLIIGSKGGMPDHPQWYLNLTDNPECEIRVSTLHTKAHARTATGEERARLWKKITEKHPVYLKYQARAPREIPVVVLEPIK